MRIPLFDCIRSFAYKMAVYQVKNDGFYKLIGNAEKQLTAGNMNGVIGFLRQGETTLNPRLGGYEEESKGNTPRAPKAKKIVEILKEVKIHLDKATESAKTDKSDEVGQHLGHIKEKFEKTEPLVQDYQTSP